MPCPPGPRPLAPNPRPDLHICRDEEGEPPDNPNASGGRLNQCHARPAPGPWPPTPGLTCTYVETKKASPQIIRPQAAAGSTNAMPARPPAPGPQPPA